MSGHTPGPWDYVPSTDRHGPYVTSEFGSTICDCYVMSQPGLFSTASGGPSKPVLHLAEMADPNARLIAAAPDMLAALKTAFKIPRPWLHGSKTITEEEWNAAVDAIASAIAKAEGQS